MASEVPGATRPRTSERQHRRRKSMSWPGLRRSLSAFLGAGLTGVLLWLLPLPKPSAIVVVALIGAITAFELLLDARSRRRDRSGVDTDEIPPPDDKRQPPFHIPKPISPPTSISLDRYRTQPSLDAEPQCPACGHFDVETRRKSRTGHRVFAFRCPTCGAVWTWEAGSPWPDVLIQPAPLETSPEPSR
jgi:hypothetical protein